MRKWKKLELMSGLDTGKEGLQCGPQLDDLKGSSICSEVFGFYNYVNTPARKVKLQQQLETLHPLSLSHIHLKTECVKSPLCAQPQGHSGEPKVNDIQTQCLKVSYFKTEFIQEEKVVIGPLFPHYSRIDYLSNSEAPQMKSCVSSIFLPLPLNVSTRQH